MSDDAYEPMDHIDWDLVDNDHTIEWLVHLCEVFNREEEEWIVWPEEFLWRQHQSVENHNLRQRWLTVAAFISQSSSITVSGNDISVAGRFGSKFKFQIMSDFTDWTVIEASRDDDSVPKEIGSGPEGFVLGNTPLCLDRPDGVPFPTGLYSLLLTLMDETKTWEYLLDWVFVDCWICREVQTKHRTDFERQGWVFDGEDTSIVPDWSMVMGSLDRRARPAGRYHCCYWCGPNAPDHH